MDIRPVAACGPARAAMHACSTRAPYAMTAESRKPSSFTMFGKSISTLMTILILALCLGTRAGAYRSQPACIVYRSCALIDIHKAYNRIDPTANRFITTNPHFSPDPDLPYLTLRLVHSSANHNDSV